LIFHQIFLSTSPFVFSFCFDFVARHHFQITFTFSSSKFHSSKTCFPALILFSMFCSSEEDAGSDLGASLSFSNL